MAEINVFLHIPKAAGSTLHFLLKRIYSKENTFFLHDEFIRNGRIIANNQELMGYQNIHNINLLMGHIDFGFHLYVDKRVKYFTILRNPVERLVSWYKYVLQNPGHYLHDVVKKKNMTLVEIIEAGLTNETDNAQCRMILGAGGHHPNDYSIKKIKYGEFNEAHYEETIQNAESYFSCIGIQEEFQKSILLLKEKLNWKIPSYRSKNVSKTSDPIDLETVSWIQNSNNYDIRLYEFCKKKFENEISQIKFLDLKVKKMRINNRLMSFFK